MPHVLYYVDDRNTVAVDYAIIFCYLGKRMRDAKVLMNEASQKDDKLAASLGTYNNRTLVT